MTALIHLHPHFSHFIQSIILTKKLIETDQIICLEAPSLQRKSVAKFFNYLYRHRHELSSVLECDLAFARLTFRRIISVLLKSTSARFLLHKSPSLRFAVRDSLIRGRYSYVYALLPQPLRQYVEFFFALKASILLKAYEVLIKECKPTICVVSHAAYVPYVAFIEAATRLGIPVLATYGAVDRSYVITKLQTVYHITNTAPLIMSEHPIDPAVLVNSGSTYAEPSSLYKLIKDEGTNSPGTNATQSIPSILVILTHCIKDNNHVSNPSDMLFPNYLTWLLLTAIQLFSKRSSYDLIIYKIHPHAKDYKDHVMLWLLGQLCANGVNRAKTVVSDYASFESDLARYGSNHKLYPVTFHGSVAYENASIALNTITVGAAPGPRGATYRPTNIKDYYSALSSPSNLPPEFHNPSNNSDVADARYLISFFEAMKPRCKKKILSLKKYFFFSESTPLQLDEFRDTYRRLQSDQSISINPLSCGINLITYDKLS